MWDFRCPQLAGWAGSLLPEQPNCQATRLLLPIHFATNFILAVKIPYKIYSFVFFKRGGMKKVNKNIFFICCPCC